MNGRKEIPLKIELLPGGESGHLLIRSKKEIRFILQEIARKGTRSALYYDTGNDFILTTLLDASEQDVWMEAGPNAEANRRALHSDKVIFVGSHQEVKVQFEARQIEAALFYERNAFRLPLPDTLLRLQRRDYYRMITPGKPPLKCTLSPAPYPSAKHGPSTPRRDAVIMDISIGGAALVCVEREAGLLPGEIYPDCRIFLPDIGTVTATIRVMNVIEITAQDGAVSRHAGCEFLHPDGKTAILLQRYITRLQAGAE